MSIPQQDSSTGQVSFGEQPQVVTQQHIIEMAITEIKQLRKDIDSNIQRVKGLKSSHETSLVITKLQEGVMWLGMELKRINDTFGVGSNPYPNSKDPSNTVIDKTAYGLKL